MGRAGRGEGHRNCIPRPSVGGCGSACQGRKVREVSGEEGEGRLKIV